MTVAIEATQQGAGKQTEERPKTARQVAQDQIDHDYDDHVEHQILAEDPDPKKTTDDETVLVDDLKRFKVRVKRGDGEEEKGLDSVMNELQTLQGRVRSMTNREKDLQQQLQQMAEKDGQLEQQLAAQRQLETTDNDEDIDASVSVMAAALINGDEDTVAENLRNILKQGRQSKTTPVDEEQIVSKVITKVTTERQQEEGKKVWDAFVKDNAVFQDQFDSESGEKVVTEERKYGDFVYEQNYREKVASGEISYREALEKTAETVGKAFAQQPEAPEKSELEKRQERKQDIDQLSVAAGVVADHKQSATEESVSDVIADMRKGRGLPT